MIHEEKYSELYRAIRREAQRWPTWKIDAYNRHYAISAHARKLTKDPGDKRRNPTGAPTA